LTPGGTVTLTLGKINPSSTPDFKGFMVEGLKVDGSTIVGSFQAG
jgi:hypothetical protein